MDLVPLKPEQYDVLLIYDEKDRPDSDDEDMGENGTYGENRLRKMDAVKGVNVFTKIIKRHVKIYSEDNGEAWRSPKVARQHIDLIGKGTLNNQLKEGIERSTYLFFYLTQSFSDAEKAKTVKEIQKMKDDALVETMKEESKENCAIPIYTLSRKETRERNFSVPFGLRSIRGIDISGIIKSGTPIDCVDNADSLEIGDINPDVVEKLEKLLNRRARDIKEREIKEEQDLTIEAMEREKERLTEKLEYTRTESRLSLENLELSREKKECESIMNGVQHSNEMDCILDQRSSCDIGEYQIGKMASGRKVAQETGQASSSEIHVSEAGCPVTTDTDNQEGRGVIDEPSDMSIGSLPPVIYPPSTLETATRATQPIAREFSDTPVLNLSENDSPSNQTAPSSEQGNDLQSRSSVGPLASLNSVMNSQANVLLSPESLSSSFMDLQDVECIPGLNLYTIKLTSDGMVRLLRKLSRKKEK